MSVPTATAPFQHALALSNARAPCPRGRLHNGGHGAQSAPLPTLRTLMLRSDDAEVWVLQASREVADRYRAVQCHRQVSERVGRAGSPVVHGVGLGQWMQATVLCVPDAVQHDAPHALLQPARTVSARRGAPLIRDLRRASDVLLR